MGITRQGDLFATGSHTSYTAAVATHPRRGAQARRYLQLLGTRGPLTDHEAQRGLGVPLASICAIRNTLITAQLVTRGFETRRGPYGHRNQTWELTREGEAAVRAMDG
jgi:hypothetical protein